VDDDVVIGLFAAEAGRVGTYYGEFRAVAIAAVVGVLAAIVTATVSFDAGFASLVAVGLTAFWVGRRVQYVADDRAADAVGAGRVADAFERVAAVRGSNRKPATGRRGSRCSRRSAIGSRRCGSEKGRRSRETPLSMKMWARYRVRSATAAVASTLTS